ncbi:hypothetical protein TUM4438_16460 [Shewanella sairae]|uniref:Uncharacterized protein n=1 Tax=Shewanella sairae TaxID=190310 RepID=A0ABQ4PBA7_9GAMM|nr:hypothetical protein [Shewanella sairae]MCL1130185.1 hypothetical protein [Shewanella sairae]GIU44687.1 hypothetical protein TUM4438_16460 [Shewanella sairae]
MKQITVKKDFNAKVDASVDDKRHFTAYSATDTCLDDRLITVFYGAEGVLEPSAYFIQPLNIDRQTEDSRHGRSSVNNSVILQNPVTPIMRDNTATNVLSKSYIARSRLSPFSVLIISVLLVHVAVIVAVNYFWVRPTVTVNKLAETTIQSYLYQAPKAEPLLESRLESKPSAATPLKDKPDDKLAVNNQDTARIKHTEVQEPSKQIKSAPKTDLSQEIDDKAKVTTALSTPSANTSKGTSAKRFTQSYLAKQRANKLDELVVSSAANYSQKRSLSEMDGEMQELIFPEIDKYSKVVTTDHVLDPNRIVRKGDTCYRIVKIGDQINPYAETIGYPFNCGGDKVKKAINEAIAARLEKRMLGK